VAVREHTIAVVDDDPAVRKALARLLSVFGCCVELFASAADFLAAAATSKAMCLLVDIELGAVSGLQLARQLAADGFEFPIVFMTGSVDSGIRRQCAELGCVAFLQKPIPEARLFEAIANAVGLDLPVA
jgi:FixJ family two-component response regulator